MRKSLIIILALLFVTAVSFSAYASVGVKKNGTLIGTAEDIELSVPINAAGFDGSTIALASFPMLTALTATATQASTWQNSSLWTLTSVINQTFYATVAGSGAGDEFQLVITASGTGGGFVFSNGFKSTGNLYAGTTSGKVYTMEFVDDGQNWNEVSRTTAM